MNKYPAGAQGNEDEGKDNGKQPADRAPDDDSKANKEKDGSVLADINDDPAKGKK